MTELKTKQTEASVEDFLNGVPSDRRRRDAFAVLDMMRRVTGEEPKMWGPSIVGFGRYRYRYDSGREGEWFLTGLSPRKQALTVYVMPGFAPFAELLDRLGAYKTGRSCLYINRLENIDEKILEKMIVQSVKIMQDRYAN